MDCHMIRELKENSNNVILEVSSFPNNLKYSTEEVSHL